MIAPSSRFLPLALIVATASASADPAHDLPACAAFDAPGADWSRIEERGFALALPPGARPEARGPSLDHEFGRWTWPDGRQVYFQYGFAVTELAGWLDEKFVTGCRASLDGVDAVLLERRDPDGTFAWAIGLFDYVQTYLPSGLPGAATPPLANDFAMIGAGRSDTVFAQGRSLFQAFRWSRLPPSSLAAWSVEGAANNGVLVFETRRGATGLMVATYRDGRPYWLVGASPGPVVTYRVDDAVGIPLKLYESTHGVVPGEADHGADVTEFADAEFVVSMADACERATLRWQPAGRGEPVTLHLRPSYPLLHGCSAFGR